MGVSMLKAWLSSHSIQSNPIPAHNNILDNKPGYRYVWNPRCQHNLSHCINNLHLRCPLHKQFKHRNQEIVQIICINLPKLNEHKAAENKNHTCSRSRVPSFYTKQIQPSHKHFILADKLNPTSTNNRTERLFWSTNFHHENIGEPCKCSPTTADLRRIKLFSSQSVTNERYKNTEQYSPFLILLWTGQLGMTR